jgi:hypothetical protein
MSRPGITFTVVIPPARAFGAASRTLMESKLGHPADQGSQSGPSAFRYGWLSPKPGSRITSDIVTLHQPEFESSCWPYNFDLPSAINVPSESQVPPSK